MLDERLSGEFGDGASVESVDVLAATRPEQMAAMDAIIERLSDFPVVFVDGCVASVGEIDTEGIVSAVARRLEALR